MHRADQAVTRNQFAQPQMLFSAFNWMLFLILSIALNVIIESLDNHEYLFTFYSLRQYLYDFDHQVAIAIV